MDSLACPNCGSFDVKRENTRATCNFCRSLFSIEIPGGKSDDSVIDLASDVQILLDKCRKDPNNRRRYVNLILDIDPHNEEVHEFL